MLLNIKVEQFVSLKLVVNLKKHQKNKKYLRGLEGRCMTTTHVLELHKKFTERRQNIVDNEWHEQSSISRTKEYVVKNISHIVSDTTNSMSG